MLSGGAACLYASLLGRSMLRCKITSLAAHRTALAGRPRYG